MGCSLCHIGLQPLRRVAASVTKGCSLSVTYDYSLCRIANSDTYGCSLSHIGLQPQSHGVAASITMGLQPLSHPVTSWNSSWRRPSHRAISKASFTQGCSLSYIGLARRCLRLAFAVGSATLSFTVTALTLTRSCMSYMWSMLAG